jgi:hypothetical protein
MGAADRPLPMTASSSLRSSGPRLLGTGRLLHGPEYAAVTQSAFGHYRRESQQLPASFDLLLLTSAIFRRNFGS